MITSFRFVFLLCLGLSSSYASASATVTIFNADPPGYGFNDTTPFKLIATGNTATTLGQARLNAIQYTVNKLSMRLNSSVNINVYAIFSRRGGDNRGAELAGALSMSFYENFIGAPLKNTLYHGAIAEKISGIDFNKNLTGQSKYDVFIRINSDVDGNVSLGSSKWYYGFDANPTSSRLGTDIDFVTVLTHELIHGIGFSTQMTSSTGARYLGQHDNFINNLEHHGASPALYSLMISDLQRKSGNNSSIYNPPSSIEVLDIVSSNLHWVGPALLATVNRNRGFESGHAGMFSPNPVQGGSSVSHFSTLFISPDEMMEPSYRGANHNIGFAAQVLEDVGWGKLNSDTRGVDLSVDVSNVNQNPIQGSNETYFITVTNKSGINPATGIVVTNFLPVNSTLVSVTPANNAECDTTNVNQNRIVSCRLPSLPASGTAIFSVVVRINNAIANIFSANVEALNPDSITTNNNAVNQILVNNQLPPTLSAVTNKLVTEGEVVQYNLSANDPNNITPVFSYTSNKQLANIMFVDNKNGTATFEWITSSSDIGDTVINFKATDGDPMYSNFSDTQTATVSVKSVTVPEQNPDNNKPSGTSNNNVPTGCTLNKSAKFDPLFPLLLSLAILYFVRKNKLQWVKSS